MKAIFYKEHVINKNHYIEYELKICHKCNKTKSWKDFSRKIKGIFGLQPNCKECSKKWWSEDPIRQKKIQKNSKLKAKFNLTLDQYNEILTHQNGKCAICHKVQNNVSLAVDHCHKTGKIRGLLCGPCNQSIGLLKEDLQIIENLKDYLEKYK